MSAEDIRWGVIGPGQIATQLAEAMELVEGGRIVAVASRAKERADAYGDRFGVERRYGTYDDLVADDGVDIVYVATPHTCHEADTLRSITAGKHVLCEKPLALNARQAGRMVDAARAHGVFLMEAVWSRFLPAYRVLTDALGSGRIGEPQLVEGDFGFRMPVDPTHRLFDPVLGGGGLLDLGIYPLQLCSLVLGPIDSIVAKGVIGPTGVDEQVAAVLAHESGGIGVIKAATRVHMASTARIAGTAGWVTLPAFMHCPMELTIAGGGRIETVDASYEGEGIQFEIREVHRCLRAGLTESPDMPLDESIRLAEALDEIRAQIGLTYPGE